MKLKALSYSTIGAITILGTAILAGCASDPNKNIASANESKREEQRAYQVNNAELKSDHRENVAEKERKVVDAHAEMSEERTRFAASVDERITKVDVKSNDVQGKILHVAGPKRAALDSDWNTLQTQRSDVAQKRKALASVPNAGWAEAKRELEKGLDDLEARADLLKSKF